MSDFKVVTCGLCGAENKSEFYGGYRFSVLQLLGWRSYERR